MLHEGEMRRSEDEFSDTMSRGMSAAVAIVISGVRVAGCFFLKHEAKEPLSCCCLLTVAAM